MTIPYDSIEKDVPTIASEPQASFGTAQSLTTPRPYADETPEGYMTLEQFGSLFHQKLDTFYARLQSDCQ